MINKSQLNDNNEYKTNYDKFLSLVAKWIRLAKLQEKNIDKNRCDRAFYNNYYYLIYS